jgi:hypothetical protein
MSNLSILWTIIKLLPTIISLVKEIYKAINGLPNVNKIVEMAKLKKALRTHNIDLLIQQRNELRDGNR